MQWTNLQKRTSCVLKHEKQEILKHTIAEKMGLKSENIHQNLIVYTLSQGEPRTLLPRCVLSFDIPT